MEAATESHTEILRDHVPDGEQLQEYYTGSNNKGTTRTIAVTDRRLLKINQDEDTNQEEIDIRSTLLTGPSVTGTRYHREEESRAPMQIFGSILAVLGGIMTFFGVLGMGNGDGSAGVLAVGGLLLLSAGIYIIYEADGRTSGDVEITVERSGVENVTVELPQGQVDVPQAVSRVVASRHSE
ncbi:hypothetical protein [Halorientalis sp. IM1011]|uniref:hypothetical protein n=1 Tax=Halorientalis sp. IM1011 TaxID=1932360 RepID=UPI0012F882BC|nr:hypothetical protein [Halorientalis sp. IM1011]